MRRDARAAISSSVDEQANTTFDAASETTTPADDKPTIGSTQNEGSDQLQIDGQAEEIETPEQQFAKLDVIGRYQLERQLDVLIENARRGHCSSAQERYQLKPIARNRLKWRMQARQSCKDDIETRDKEGLVGLRISRMARQRSRDG